MEKLNISNNAKVLIILLFSPLSRFAGFYFHFNSRHLCGFEVILDYIESLFLQE